MSKYRFFCGDNSVDIDYQTTDVTGILDNVNSGKFEVIAIDNRGNPKSVIKQAINIYEYSPLEKGNIEISRSNGISEEVTLKLEGKVDLFTYGTGNEITFSKYRYKQIRESEWSEYQLLALTIQDNKFSFNGLISGDEGVNGFNIENSYQIEVLIKDKLTEVLYIYTLGSGIPNIALHKNGVSIMGKYDTSIGGDLQVRGKKIGEGDTLPIGAIVDFEGDTIPQGYEEITEMSGSNSNGSWIKFADGTMICWFNQEITTAITNNWGSLYASDLEKPFHDFSQEFIEVPTINITLTKNSSAAWICTSGSSSTKATTKNVGSIGLVRPTSMGSTTFIFNVIAIGRWK